MNSCFRPPLINNQLDILERAVKPEFLIFFHYGTRSPRFTNLRVKLEFSFAHISKYNFF